MTIFILQIAIEANQTMNKHTPEYVFFFLKKVCNNFYILDDLE